MPTAPAPAPVSIEAWQWCQFAACVAIELHEHQFPDFDIAFRNRSRTRNRRVTMLAMMPIRNGSLARADGPVSTMPEVVWTRIEMRSFATPCPSHRSCA